jgi:hypothetical protein
LIPILLAAQRRPVELGVDGGLGLNFNGRTLTTFSVPIQSLRVGFMVSNNVSIEPSTAINILKLEGSEAIATISLSLSGLFHFTPDRSTAQAYFRPQAGLNFITGGGESASQFGAGGGFGVKMPVADQIAIRLDGSFVHSFENDDFAASNGIAATVGFSVFTH